MRTDLQVRAEELLEIIFSDLQYLSPDEPEVMRSWVQSVKEPVEELHGMGMELFSIQDCREGFVGEPGNKNLLENWTTGYYLLVLEHGCFSAKKCVHRFSTRVATSRAGWYEGGPVPFSQRTHGFAYQERRAKLLHRVLPKWAYRRVHDRGVFAANYRA
jgi:hypothetical protein